MLAASFEGNNGTQDLFILFHFVILNKFPEIARVYKVAVITVQLTTQLQILGYCFLLLNTYLMCLVLGGPLDTDKQHRHRYWEMKHGVSF